MMLGDLLGQLPTHVGCIRKLGAGGDGRQRVGLIVALHLRVAVEADGSQPGSNCVRIMSRPDLGDVAGEAAACPTCAIQWRRPPKG